MKNQNFLEVLGLITHLLEDGYQIRFPGGTSIDGTSNSLVVLMMIDSNKKLFVALVPYELNANILDLDDNETIKSEDGKSLAVRKVKDEVGYIVKESDLTLIEEYEKRDNRHEIYVPHIKRIYVAEKFSGKLLDVSNGSLLRRETLNPFWCPASLLSEYLFEKHLIAFEQIIDYLHKRSRLNSRDYEAMKEGILKRRFLDDKNKKRKTKKRKQIK